MVDLLDIATREFVYGRPENAMQIFKDGIGYNFHLCWQIKQRYERWIEGKTEKTNEQNDN